MIRTKLVFAGLVFAGLALLVALQIQSFARLRAENAALREGFCQPA